MKKNSFIVEELIALTSRTEGAGDEEGAKAVGGASGGQESGSPTTPPLSAATFTPPGAPPAEGAEKEEGVETPSATLIMEEPNPTEVMLCLRVCCVVSYCTL